MLAYTGIAQRLLSLRWFCPGLSQEWLDQIIRGKHRDVQHPYKCGFVLRHCSTHAVLMEMGKRRAPSDIIHTESARKPLANKRDETSLRAVELCVGAGGLALGASGAGVTETTVIDNDRNACQTLRQNKVNRAAYTHNWTIVEADIGELDFSRYAEPDILVGGPPCQPFSRGGKRNGRTDEREMFPHFIRAVRECATKALIIENVKGLRDPSFFYYFCYIVLQLQFPVGNSVPVAFALSLSCFARR